MVSERPSVKSLERDNYTNPPFDESPLQKTPSLVLVSKNIAKVLLIELCGQVVLNSF